jgi:hypothetical protein
MGADRGSIIVDDDEPQPNLVSPNPIIAKQLTKSLELPQTVTKATDSGLKKSSETKSFVKEYEPFPKFSSSDSVPVSSPVPLNTSLDDSSDLIQKVPVTWKGKNHVLEFTSKSLALNSESKLLGIVLYGSHAFFHHNNIVFLHQKQFLTVSHSNVYHIHRANNLEIDEATL